MGKVDNYHRGLVDISKKAINSRNYTKCDPAFNGDRRRLYSAIHKK